MEELKKNFDLEESLDNRPLCQMLTGKNKKFTICYDSNYIVKGPYLSTSKTYLKVINVSKNMKKFNSPYIVHPLDVIARGKNRFLVFKNHMEHTENFSMSDDCLLQHITHGVRRGKNINYLRNRKNLSKFLDYLQYQNITYYRRSLCVIIQKLLLTLVNLYILNVGDVHLSNILYDEGKDNLFVIDYEEERDEENKKDTPFFYMSIVPNIKVRKYILPYLIGSYKNLADYLEGNPLYKDFDRTKLAIENLRKYSKIDFVSAYPSYNYKTDSSNNDLDKNLYILGGPFGLYSEMNFEGDKSTVYTMSKSFSGIDKDVVRSALQKFIRRGMADRAVQVVAEMIRPEELVSSFHESCIKRLIIIACEDVGVANLPLVLNVLKLLSSDETVSPYVILSATDLLARSKKTRISSHINDVYLNTDKRDIINESNENDNFIEILDDSILNVEDKEKFLLNLTRRRSNENEETVIKIMEEFRKFEKLLVETGENREEMMPLSENYNKLSFFSYLKNYLLYSKYNGKTIKQVSHNSDIIYKHAIKNIGEAIVKNEPYMKEIFSIILDATKIVSETRPLFYLLVLSSVISQELDIRVSTEVEDNVVYWHKETHRLFYSKTKMSISNDEKLYVQDKHTKSGRQILSRRANPINATEHFRTISSLISNESNEFKVPIYEKIYKAH